LSKGQEENASNSSNLNPFEDERSTDKLNEVGTNEVHVLNRNANGWVQDCGNKIDEGLLHKSDVGFIWEEVRDPTMQYHKDLYKVINITPSAYPMDLFFERHMLNYRDYHFYKMP
jgi:hypothetical protein